GELFAGHVWYIRPKVEANRRADAHPGQAAIRKPRPRPPDCFSGGEIQVVLGHDKLTHTDPELQQTRIDIDKSRSSEAGEQFRIDAVIEVQQQIRVPANPLGFGL